MPSTDELEFGPFQGLYIVTHSSLTVHESALPHELAACCHTRFGVRSVSDTLHVTPRIVY